MVTGEMEEPRVEGRRRRSRTKQQRNGPVHGGATHVGAMAAHVLGRRINNTRHKGKTCHLRKTATDSRGTNNILNDGARNKMMAVAAQQQEVRQG